MRDTQLLLEGVSPDSISVGFLVDLMDVAEAYGYSIEGISVVEGGCREESFDDWWP